MVSTRDFLRCENKCFTAHHSLVMDFNGVFNAIGGWQSPCTRQRQSPVRGCQESQELGELSGWQISNQRQVSFQFHHFVSCYHPEKLKIEHRQRAKLRETQCTYFSHNSCSWRHFDSPGTLRAHNISARAEVRHEIATKFQPGQPGWNSPCNQTITLTFMILSDPIF